VEELLLRVLLVILQQVEEMEEMELMLHLILVLHLNLFIYQMFQQLDLFLQEFLLVEVVVVEVQHYLKDKVEMVVEEMREQQVQIVDMAVFKILEEVEVEMVALQVKKVD
jgi:hypothetical protein